MFFYRSLSLFIIINNDQQLSKMLLVAQRCKPLESVGVFPHNLHPHSIRRVFFYFVVYLRAFWYFLGRLPRPQQPAGVAPAGVEPVGSRVRRFILLFREAGASSDFDGISSTCDCIYTPFLASVIVSVHNF